VVLGGLDKPARVMSTEYDLIYVQEAIELEEGAWEALSTRLRNGRMPYQQLLADTNPSSPTHWLKQRCDAGRCVLLESRHEDNPTVTPEYLARLDQLTGARLQRLRYGRWAQAEGVVYDEWDPARHVLWPGRPGYPSAAERRSWRRIWAVDFGFTNPFVWQEWGIDGDGRMYLLREIYRTGRLVEEHVLEVLRVVQDAPGPEVIVCDHDAEDRATLERHLGLARTVRAHKDVSPGIQAVKARLQPAADGRPRLFVLGDAGVGRDPALVDAGRPTGTVAEFDGYVWDSAAAGGPKETPRKADDHGLDALRYAVAWVDALGRRPLRVY
jgi:phage terminase large subunit